MLKRYSRCLQINSLIFSSLIKMPSINTEFTQQVWVFALFLACGINLGTALDFFFCILSMSRQCSKAPAGFKAL